MYIIKYFIIQISNQTAFPAASNHNAETFFQPQPPMLILQNIVHVFAALRGRRDDGVEVDSAAGRADIGDRGRPSRRLPVDSDHDVSSAAGEGHLHKLHSSRDREVLANAANPDRDGGSSAGGGNDKDAVADAVLGAAVGTRVVAGGAAVGADGLGSRAIPEDGARCGDGDIASPGLVGSDVVWKDESPGVVGHVVDVNLRTSNDALRPDWAEVVGFTVVVPRDEL